MCLVGRHLVLQRFNPYFGGVEVEFGLLKFVLQVQDVSFKIVVAYQRGL
jgi:hypothetical protein